MGQGLLWGIAIAVLVAIVGGFFLFSGSSDDTNANQGIAVVDTDNSQATQEIDSGSTTTDTTTDADQDTTPPVQETKEFTIRESNFKLSPSTIQVNKGDKVKLTIINDGGTHNLFVEGYNERVEIVSSGSTQVMEFIADKEGTFKMWCEVGSHRQIGMEGELIVI